MSDATFGPQPELTDGVVVLRPWRDEDIDPARLAHDEEIAHWFGFPVVTPSYEQHKVAVDNWRTWYAEGRSRVNFVVDHDGDVVGSVEVRTKGDGIGELSWILYAGHRGHGYAARAVSMLVDYAFRELGLTRVEAYVNPANERSLRVATRSGLRREGVLRGREWLFGERHDSIVFARLSDDPPISDPASFRALLNSFLPRKRAISQMLIRSTDGRVLLCRLTYKKDWDLPGGVVEVGESPQLAVSREVSEELGLTVGTGSLLLTDWLPPWGGWDDAVCLVFDGGVHHPSLIDRVVVQPREIRSAKFCAPDEVRSLAADFTSRRIESAVANLAAGGGGDGGGGGGGPSYTESGR